MNDTDELVKVMAILNDRGIESSISMNKNNVVVLSVEGFYKEGAIQIFVDGDSFFTQLRGRIGNTRICWINQDILLHLTELNFDLWMIHRNRFEDWKNPNEKWLPFLLGYDFIEEVVTVSYKEKGE